MHWQKKRVDFLYFALNPFQSWHSEFWTKFTPLSLLFEEG